MSEIYVFDGDFYSDDVDFTSMGIVGALMPTECIFTEEANGESSVTMKHPIDPYGKYQALQRGNILIVPVPTNGDPTSSSDPENTTVWYYEVKDAKLTTSEAQRTLYKNKTGDAKIKVLDGGTRVTVIEKSVNDSDRWKVRCSAGTGYMSPNGLNMESEQIATFPSLGGYTSGASWKVSDQPFRIYETSLKLDEVEVKARHISYDLMYNTTKFKSLERHPCSYVLEHIMSESFSPSDFNIYTNASSSDDHQYTGYDFSGKNLIECMLDEDDGLCALFGLFIVRDWTDIGLITDPGVNRGVTIEYGKNLTGITMESNEEDVVTRVIPVGEDKDGEKLYLDNDLTKCYVDSDLIEAYPVPHCYELSCENSKVGEKMDDEEVTEEIAKANMQKQAEDYFKYTKCDEPEINVKIEFQDMDATDQGRGPTDYESLQLYDFVNISVPHLSYKDKDGEIQTVNVVDRVTKIEWDCILDRMKSVELGKVYGTDDSDVSSNSSTSSNGVSYNGNAIGNRIAYNRRVDRKDISNVMRSVSRRWRYQIDGLPVENAVINFITLKDDLEDENEDDDE